MTTATQLAKRVKCTWCKRSMAQNSVKSRQQMRMHGLKGSWHTACIVDSIQVGLKERQASKGN